jgi:hypothetical protein
MKGYRLLLAASLFLTGSTVAQDTIPKTVEGGGHTIKEGGQEIGEGFRGVGRGVKDVFTGKRSKEDFEEASKIGDGFKDVGRGTAGVGRGVGRDIKKGFQDKDTADEE